MRYVLPLLDRSSVVLSLGTQIQSLLGMPQTVEKHLQPKSSESQAVKYRKFTPLYSDGVSHTY